MNKPTISGIVAISENKVIGRDGTLPWDIPEDLQFFRDKTKGHTMIMGRKTFDSIGRALPHRISIIITRDKAYKAEGCIVVHSLEEAMKIAKEKETNGEIFIIGGGQIFSMAMPLIDTLYLTVVHATIEGDAIFPDYSEFSTIVNQRDSSNDNFTYTFFELTR